MENLHVTLGWLGGLVLYKSFGYNGNDEDNIAIG